MRKRILSKLRFLDPDYYTDLLSDRLKLKKRKGVQWKLVGWALILVVYLVYAAALYSALGLLFGTTEPLVIVTSGSMEPVFFRGDVMFLQGVSPQDLKAGAEVTLNLTGLGSKHIRDFAVLHYEDDKTCQLLINQVSRTIALQCPPVQTIGFTQGVNEPITLPITTEGDVVVYNSSSGEEVIHRVVVKINTPEGVFLLTKGDNALTNTTIDQDCFDVRDETFCAITDYPISFDDVKGRTWFRIPLIGYLKLLLFGR